MIFFLAVGILAMGVNHNGKRKIKLNKDSFCTHIHKNNFLRKMCNNKIVTPLELSLTKRLFKENVLIKNKLMEVFKYE